MTRHDDTDFLPFARPSITEREKQAVLDVLDSGWLTTGPRTKAFEEEFAGRSARVTPSRSTRRPPPSISRSRPSASAPSDEVIVPTWTFAASAEVVAYRGARPVLVDVDPRTLERHAGSRAGGGHPDAPGPSSPSTSPACRSRSNGWSALLEARGIAVVEDAAHAFPSRIGGPDGRYAGTYRRGRGLLVLRHQDDHDRRGRDARHRRRRPSPIGLG